MTRYLVFLLVFSCQSVNACECLWQGSFIESAPKADLIVSGQVINIKGNSADLAVKSVLSGQTFLDQIRVWGNDGQECRPDINDFPVGSQWVMALHQIDQVPANGFNPNTPNISFGRKGDFYLSACGANWLSLGENLASGNLIDGPRWEYQDKKMNPVLLELIDAYLHQQLSVDKLKAAATPSTERKKLLLDTKWFLRSQQ